MSLRSDERAEFLYTKNVIEIAKELEVPVETVFRVLYGFGKLFEKFPNVDRDKVIKELHRVHILNKDR